MILRVFIYTECIWAFMVRWLACLLRIRGHGLEYRPRIRRSVHPAVYSLLSGWSINSYYENLSKVNRGNPDITLALYPGIKLHLAGRKILDISSSNDTRLIKILLFLLPHDQLYTRVIGKTQCPGSGLVYASYQTEQQLYNELFISLQKISKLP